MKEKISHLTIYSGSVIVVYFLLGIFLGFVLEFDFSQTDADYYWQDSLNWRTPFNPYHVPGYALMISFFRFITFFSVSPLLIMMGINLGALLISMLMIRKILQHHKLSNSAASLGGVIFALWPFVGLVYCVDPIADLPVMAVFLTGIYFWERGKFINGSVWWGMALVLHKAIWPFVALTLLFNILWSGSNFPRKKIPVIILIIVGPLFCLWLAGAFHYLSIFWIIGADLKLEIMSHHGLPVLDGLLGTFLQGGAKGKIKALIVFSIAILTVYTFYLSYRDKEHGLSSGRGICLSILLLMAILNQHEIWASVRFSRLLVLPLFCHWGFSGFSSFLKKYRNIILIFSLIILISSQFIYGWYMARIHYPSMEPINKIKLENHVVPYQKLGF